MHLLDQGLSITTEKVERILQAALFYADSVHVRASSAGAGENTQVSRKLHELREIGALATWAHEYEVTAGGQLRPGYLGALGRTRVGRVLTFEENRAIVDRVDDDLALDPTRPYDNVTHLREGVSEVVQLRHVLSSLRFTEMLGAGGILARNDGRSGIMAAVQRTALPVSTHTSVVQTIVDSCSFRSLSALPIQGIVECRTHVAGFRADLDNALGSGRPDEVTDRAATFARQVVAEYRKITAAHSTLADFPPNTTWNVLGALLPSAVLTRTLRKPLQWFRGKKSGHPFLLISALSAYHPYP